MFSGAVKVRRRQGDEMMLRAWLEDAWRWIGDPTGRIVEVTAAALVIVTTIVAAITAIGRRIRPLSSTLISAWGAASVRLDMRSAISCGKLRVGVLLAGPDALINMARKSDFVTDSDSQRIIAQALAFIGKSEDAKPLHLTGTAWGIAIRSGPKAAMQFMEPQKNTGIAGATLYEALVRTVDTLRNDAEMRDWQINKALTVPFGDILDSLIKDSPEIGMPSCLNDASLYVKSKPVEFNLWVTARDKKLLRPINKKGLRALRRIVLRKASCKSLPGIAANLAMLAYAQEYFRRR
jgi:hypothetical protein